MRHDSKIFKNVPQCYNDSVGHIFGHENHIDLFQLHLPGVATRGRFRNTYELLHLRALKFSPVNKIHIFQCMGMIFLWNFKGTLWNSTQNILPIHWKIRILYNIEILRTLRSKSSYAFFKCPPERYGKLSTMPAVALDTKSTLRANVDYLSHLLMSRNDVKANNSYVSKKYANG